MPCIRPCFFLNAKNVQFFDENHRGSPTLTFLNMVDVVMGPNVLNVLNVRKDASLVCWVLSIDSRSFCQP